MNIVVQKESLVLRLYSSLHHSLYACLLVNLSKVTCIALECSFGYSSFGYSQRKKETVRVKWGQVVCDVGRHDT